MMNNQWQKSVQISDRVTNSKKVSSVDQEKIKKKKKKLLFSKVRKFATCVELDSFKNKNKEDEEKRRSWKIMN